MNEAQFTELLASVRKAATVTNEQFSIFLDLLHSQMTQAREAIEANVDGKLDKQEQTVFGLALEPYYDELQPLYDVLDELQRYSASLEKKP